MERQFQIFHKFNTLRIKRVFHSIKFINPNALSFQMALII